METAPHDTQDGETPATWEGEKAPSRNEFDAFTPDSRPPECEDDDTAFGDSEFSTGSAHADRMTDAAARPCTAASRRMLIIEDNPRDARLIEALLGSAIDDTVAIEKAFTLEEGLARLAAGGIDLVLSDLNLPDSSPAETLQRLRGVAPEIPLIVLSGEADDGVRQAAREAGALAYLAKGDVNNETIVAQILRRLGETAGGEG